MTYWEGSLIMLIPLIAIATIADCKFRFRQFVIGVLVGVVFVLGTLVTK